MPMLISGLYVVSFASIERTNAGASEKVTKIWQAFRKNSTFLQLRSHFSSFGHHFCWLFGATIIIIIGIWELSNTTKVYSHGIRMLLVNCCFSTYERLSRLFLKSLHLHDHNRTDMSTNVQPLIRDGHQNAVTLHPATHCVSVKSHANLTKVRQDSRIQFYTHQMGWFESCFRDIRLQQLILPECSCAFSISGVSHFILEMNMSYMIQRQ